MGHLNRCGCWGGSINQTFFLLEPNGLDLINTVSVFFLYSFKTILWVTALFWLLWKFSEVKTKTQLMPYFFASLREECAQKRCWGLLPLLPVLLFAWIHCSVVFVSSVLPKLFVPSSPRISSMGAKPMVRSQSSSSFTEIYPVPLSLLLVTCHLTSLTPLLIFLLLLLHNFLLVSVTIFILVVPLLPIF